VTAFTEEHVFIVEALDASLHLPSFLASHGVVTYSDYIARCGAKCDAAAE
jgi:hypothetical protein